jgi:hypothetical protein
MILLKASILVISSTTKVSVDSTSSCLGAVLSPWSLSPFLFPLFLVESPALSTDARDFFTGSFSGITTPLLATEAKASVTSS